MSSFDLRNELEIQKAFAPENHQWLSAKENLKKSDKIPHKLKKGKTMRKEQVSIKNRGSETFKETFQEKEYVIEPGETIQMQRRDAIRFLGTFPGMDKNTGKPIVKNLVIETIEQETPEPVANIESPLADGQVKCPFGCGFVAKNKLSLSTHLRTCRG